MNALLLGLALSIGAPGLKDPPKTEPKIIGDWKLVEWLQGGGATSFGEGTGVQFLPGGKRIWRYGPGQTDEREYKLYPKTSPAEIDLVPNPGVPQPIVFPCIFKIEADTLVIAVGQPGGDRPKKFEANDGRMLMTFTRIKPKD